MNATNNRIEKTYQEITSEADFHHQIDHSTFPVLVDFYAPWCGPCQALNPIIDKVSRDLVDEVKILKVNVDNHRELAREYGITSIPTLVLYIDGKPLERIKGFIPETTLKQFIRKNRS